MMNTKVCFKCEKEKPLSDFYKHKKMGDGHLNKCKECAKIDVSTHRKANIENIRAYDRKRGCRQDKKYRDQYKKRFPIKYKAHNIVSNATRDKKLFREPCEICGAEERVHAHHDDYARPLNVRWLCAAHHSQWHAEHGEAANAR